MIFVVFHSVPSGFLVSDDYKKWSHFEKNKSSAKDATAPISVRARSLQGLYCFFCSTTSGIDNRRLGHSVGHTKKKEPPRCHQLPHVRPFLNKKQLLFDNTKKNDRTQKITSDSPTLFGSGRTSLTDCRTTPERVGLHA